MNIINSDTCPSVEIAEGEIVDLFIQNVDGSYSTINERAQSLKGPVMTISI